MGDRDIPTSDSSAVWAVQWSGRRLKDRYRIEKELGRGGFGVVYLARDEQLHERPVVVKVLLEQGSEQGEWFTKKFHQEREALARLDHPGVVGVLDAGETAEGKPFLVMQFVDGVTLRTALRQSGPLELARVAKLVKQLGQALGAAHEKGIYHRDLKPENIMLQDLGGGEELVKIIDFGIATVREAQAASQAEQTRAAGSGPYMAPEQLLGRPGAASDIYALGVIAYELVTGQRPFQPDSLAHMYVLQQQGVQTRPRELRPELGAAAEACILKAMASRESERHGKAREFGEELAQALAAGEVAGAAPPAAAAPAAAEKKSRRRLAAVLAAAAAAAGGAGATAWFALRSGPSYHYSILVQKYREGQPDGQPFVLPGEMLFQPEYRIRLRIGSGEAGHLYLLNEGPVAEGGLPSYNLVHPGAGESALLPAGQEISIPGGDHWMEFDRQEGTENLWMIWSARPVPQMEAAKQFGTAVHAGTIRDEKLVRALQAFLSSQPGARVERQEAGRRTLVRGRGQIVTRLLKLEHH
jgi:serine/threonine protein kinase